MPNAPGAFAALRPPKPAPQSSTPGAAKTASEPTTLASVRLPQSAPLPKDGDAPAEQPTTIAGLLGNLFGGSRTSPGRPRRKPTTSQSRCAVPMKGPDQNSACRGPHSVSAETPATPRLNRSRLAKPVAMAAPGAGAESSRRQCTSGGAEAARRSGREARDAGVTRRG